MSRWYMWKYIIWLIIYCITTTCSVIDEAERENDGEDIEFSQIAQGKTRAGESLDIKYFNILRMNLYV